MSSRKFDPHAYFEEPQAVAAVVDPEELFGLWNRAVTLPGDVAALVARPQGDEVLVRAGEELTENDQTEIVFVRTGCLDLTVTEDDIPSADKMQGKATVDLRIALIAQRNELSSFRTQFMGSRRRIDRAGIIGHLRPAVRRALIQTAAKHAMGALVDATCAEAVGSALEEALSKPCFVAGLAVQGAPRVRFESAGLDQVRHTEARAAKRQREQAAQRELQRAVESAQQDHVQHLEGVLEKLKQLAEDAPQVGLPELLQTFSESQRGQIYAALFASGARQPSTRWIVVAVGSELLFYEPASTESARRRIVLDESVGAVRSIQSTGPAGSLLVGAARGVYALTDAGQSKPRVYAFDGQVEVRGGVNSAVVAGERLLASHSEVGLVCWPLDRPDEPQHLLTGLTASAKAVRAVQFFEGRVYCSIDENVLAFDAEDPTESNVRVYRGSDSLITAVCPTPQGIYAGNAAGQILHWPDETEASPRVIHAGNRRAAESLGVLSAAGIDRLFFTDTGLAVHARVLGDAFACRFEAGGQTLRRVEIAPDLIVATNEIRDRLLLWKPDQPTNPHATISVARQTGRSVQDVCLLAVG
ncbi:MAG: hypothetical protein ACE5GE_06145 [Phycisphaerae bacterium]